MGSLVISQVAPSIGQQPYHHMMVDSTPHRDDSSRGRSTSSSQIPQVQEPPEDETTPTSNPHHHESAHGRSSSSHSHQSSFYPQNVNQHSRGFDQSGFPLTSDPRAVVAESPPSPRLQPTYRSTRSLGASEASSPSRIKVRDLSHIRSLASEEYLNRPRLAARSASTFAEAAKQYEISAMPVTDIIEMVAGLLTRITTTNDRQHEHHRPVPLTEEQSHLNPHASCVLAFHGKNVPGITILSYLSRIHKYCPTTYEVFLSLLVYFDRMTEIVNRGLLASGQRRPSDSPATAPESFTPTPRSPAPMHVDSPQELHDIGSPVPASDSGTQAQQQESTPAFNSQDLSQFFVVDSYNIHRLVIAGVTCASKFFSDVFYTNSRYAKVGGLPLAELNNLELQFLLLNDFRLSVPVEELEAYGTMLVEFYARELLAQQQLIEQQQQGGSGVSSPPSAGAGEGMYMRGGSSSRDAAPSAPVTS
ncbi:cyclin-like protein interacting with PHO85 [Cladophialophora chaetospira]|uniref:Cyclin-like protein interacting with PHO85 n=1 Tax=Cladophialophora chaetospira TaxID=386627 RepID=A0AA38X1D4_9EURO|nr:cyclin-like protein interacting with PHO85 [Cladophialophora chaetospira]